MYYYNFNIGDYASHTRHLSPIEDIAYRRLLDLAYTSESAIPADIHSVSRLINLREYKQEISDVLAEFFVLVDEGWINNRVLKEIEVSGGRTEKAKTAAQARWKKHKDAKLMQTQCSDDARSIKLDASSKENDATQDTGHRTQDTGHKKTISAKALLSPHNIPEQIVQDWLTVRKAKRSPLTQASLDMLVTEAAKAGITVSEAVTICARRGWVGFKASWDWKTDGGASGESTKESARKKLFGENT